MQLLTPYSIQRAYGLNRRAVYEMLRVGAITPYGRTLNGVALFTREEVERALAHRAATGDRRRRGAVGPMETKS